MSEQHAHVVYTKLLLARGHGYPLWIPEPDYTLPPEYIDKGICVGDVVIIRDDGGFDFLFNIFLEADHPINRDRVPPHFEPLPGSKFTTRTIYLQHGRRSSVTSSLVATHSIAAGGSASVPSIAGGGGGVEFTTSKEQAAILVLPGGATRFDTNHPSLMRNYALEHAHEWYEFVNGPTQGREALNGSLVLVSGCDKAATWGSAAMSRPSADYSVKLTFSFPGVAEGQIALGSSWTTQLWTTTRLFPDVSGLAFDPSKENQGVFIRGFTISVRERKRVSKVLPVPWRSDVQLAKLSRPLPNISSKVPYSRSPPISGPAWGTQGTSDRGYLQKDDLTKLISSIVESHLDDVENASLSSPSADDTPASIPTYLKPDIPYVTRPPTTTESGRVDIQVFPERSIRLLNPSVKFNEYVLTKVPESDVVVTHDSTWIETMLLAQEKREIDSPEDSMGTTNIDEGSDLPEKKGSTQVPAPSPAPSPPKKLPPPPA